MNKELISVSKIEKCEVAGSLQRISEANKWTCEVIAKKIGGNMTASIVSKYRRGDVKKPNKENWDAINQFIFDYSPSCGQLEIQEVSTKKRSSKPTRKRNRGKKQEITKTTNMYSSGETALRQFRELSGINTDVDAQNTMNRLCMYYVGKSGIDNIPWEKFSKQEVE